MILLRATQTPRVDARYWTAIALASVFGTNLGDLYAHESGLGIGLGLLLLAVAAVVVFLVARKSALETTIFYWLVIVVVRTGATNIADYLAFGVRVPGAVLTLLLAALIALGGWLHGRMAPTGHDGTVGGRIAPTGPAYWVAMLGAGVLGTVDGDIAQHLIGQVVAGVGLTVVFVTLLTIRGVGAGAAPGYWITVAVARTAGTAVGDWLAESRALELGLPLATLISGIGFTVVLIARHGRSGGKSEVISV